MKMTAAACTFLLLFSLAGCETAPTKEDIGTVAGGVAGGVIGSQVGGGIGGTVATIGGVLLGAWAGREAGRWLDEEDERKAAQAIEENRTVAWTDEESGNEIEVNPTRTFRNEAGQLCRDYTSEVIIDGERETARGTACRQEDGTWKILN